MPFDPFSPLPLSTVDLPGVGGRIKQVPEDFEVEEIPAYEPSGSGEFLYLWIGAIGPGRRGGLAPRLPQIRTCPIRASGSSDHGLAT
jgi:tRNA pseudouridine synthase D (TruD)